MVIRQSSRPLSHLTHATGNRRCTAMRLILITVFYLVAVEAILQPIGQTKLELVQVVFRHGNRTPEFPYENDPNANETFYPYGWDELDKFGRKSSYDLGRYLRIIYGGFARDFKKDEINITTTDIRRTKMSAQLVAAGLFPPSDDWKWGSRDELGEFWQPTAFHYIPLYQDNFLYMKNVPCPQYQYDISRLDNGPIMKNALLTDPELVKAFSINSKATRTVHNMARVYQTLEIEEFYNLTIPEWIKPFYPERLRKFYLMHFKMNAWNKRMQRLRSGPLLKHILQQMQLKTTGSKMKMWLYAGHDDTLTTLGYNLGVWDAFMPRFSNALIIELHSDADGKYFVKTLFHNDTSRPPTLLTVPDCSAWCPLDDFRTLNKESVPANHTQECQLRDSAVTNKPQVLLFVCLTFMYYFREYL